MTASPSKPPKNLTGKTIDTPEGKVRPGRRTPYKKATLEEMEERIDYTLKLLIRGATKAEIHKAMRDKYGLDWSSTDRTYLPRAEKIRLERANISTGAARDIVITTLLDCVKTEKGTVRVSAARELSEIFGLYAPKQMRLGDPNGQPMAAAVIAPTVNIIITDNGRAKPPANIIELPKEPAAVITSGASNGNGH